MRVFLHHAPGVVFRHERDHGAADLLEGGEEPDVQVGEVSDAEPIVRRVEAGDRDFVVQDPRATDAGGGDLSRR